MVEKFNAAQARAKTVQAKAALAEKRRGERQSQIEAQKNNNELEFLWINQRNLIIQAATEGEEQLELDGPVIFPYRLSQIGLKIIEQGEVPNQSETQKRNNAKKNLKEAEKELVDALKVLVEKTYNTYKHHYHGEKPLFRKSIQGPFRCN